MRAETVNLDKVKEYNEELRKEWLRERKRKAQEYIEKDLTISEVVEDFSKQTRIITADLIELAYFIEGKLDANG